MIPSRKTLSIFHSVHEACQNIGIILNLIKANILLLDKILTSKEENNRKYGVIFNSYVYR